MARREDWEQGIQETLPEGCKRKSWGGLVRKVREWAGPKVLGRCGTNEVVEGMGSGIGSILSAVSGHRVEKRASVLSRIMMNMITNTAHALGHLAVDNWDDFKAT